VKVAPGTACTSPSALDQPNLNGALLELDVVVVQEARDDRWRARDAMDCWPTMEVDFLVKEEEFQRMFKVHFVDLDA
jgi:hypothetical protein